MTSLRSPGVIALLLAFGLPAPALTAADGPHDAIQGTISGQVVDRSNQRPLANVQVTIPELQMGTVTEADGTFSLTNVPVGTHELAAQFIGYERTTQEVAVVEGEVVTVNLALASRAIAMDEVVVTSSPAGEARRRAIGTTIASVDVENSLRDAPVTSLNDVLQGREPGIVNMSASGSTGTAGLNVLRGITSLTQDNQPLIYVDGVRIDRTNRSEVSTGGQTLSRLNDINPQDISRVEVIKGSAATAMYGSEASSGVIQIFTKQGRPGEVTYDVGLRLGANQIPQELPLQHPDPQYPSANDFLSTGLYQEYTGAVRGATDQLSYYVSGSHMDNEGSFVNNFQARTTGRGNMSFRPSESFSGDLSTSFSRQRTRVTANDNWIAGILTNVYLGNPVGADAEVDPYGSAFEPVQQELQRERYDSNTRYTAGLTLNHRPGWGFSHRVALGLDYLGSGGSTLDPWFERPGFTADQGGKSESKRETLNTNIDYGASLTRTLSSQLEGELSFGGQFYTREMHVASASGNRFIAPPLQSIGGTEDRGAGEGELSYTTGGLFSQFQLGYEDRLFLIAGLRADGSSAFGEDFGFSTFPKASISWVTSEESWFDFPRVSMLRLRGGWGTAGTQPGAFDKLRLWSTTRGMDGQMGFRPSRQGNPDLGPEVSTEYEAGFDLGLAEDRVTFEFTAYHQTTDDILVDYQFPVSTGILASQLRNAGSVQNRGIELNASFSVVDLPGLTWNLNAGYAYNSNEVLDLAGTPRQVVDRFGTQIVEGYPIAGKWEQVIVDYDGDGMPIVSDTAHYIGPSIPPHTGNVGSDLSWGPLTLRANGQFAMGHVVNHHLKPYMAQNNVGVPYFTRLEEVGGDTDHPDFQRFLAEMAVYGEFIEDADWFKLREISASYALPGDLSRRIGASDVRFTAAARNLLTLTKYSGVDPEVSSTFSSGNNLSVGADYFTVPPSKQFVFGVNMTF